MAINIKYLILFILLPMEAIAADQETIVITASRSQQNQFESERSIELVDRETLEQAQTRSVPEATEEAVGVYLQQTNRGSGTPFIRGLSGPQNLILVDGVRFNTSTFRTGPNQYLALVDPFILQRIELVRGPSSVLYGNGAMGGVIHLMTMNANTIDEDFGIGGRAHGKFSSADLSSGFALQVEPKFHQANLLVGAHFDRFGPLWAGGGAKQPLSDYNVGYWHGKATWAGGDNWSLTSTYLGAALRDTGRTDQAGKGDIRFYDNDDHLAYLTFNIKSQKTLRQVNASLSYHHLEERIRRFNCAKNEDGTVADLTACFNLDESQLIRQRRYNDIVDVLGADANVELAWWSNRILLNSGFEFYQEYVDSSLEVAQADQGFVFEPQARGNFSNGSRYQTLGLYLHSRATILDFGLRTGQLRLSGGVRFSQFSAFAPDVPDIGDVDFAYRGLVGSAGIQWLRPGIYNIYFTFVQGFRAPNLQETTQAGDTGQKFNIPNPDLKPEKSNTIEVGGRLYLKPVELAVAYFHSFGSDAIMWQATAYQGQTEIEGKPVTQLVNALEGSYDGLEGSLGLQWWRMKLSAGLAWMQGDVKHEDGSTTPARRVPPWYGTAGLRYDHPDQRLYLAFLVRWSLKQDRLHPQDLLDARICQTAPFSGVLESPCDGTPSWATLNLRMGWRASDQVVVRLAVNNLSDVHYRTHGSGFDAPGFDMRLTTDVSF
jgi:outer membrane receptor protein involved in Fe transport